MDSCVGVNTLKVIYLFIYLFIVCHKPSMWQSHVSKYEAGEQKVAVFR